MCGSAKFVANEGACHGRAAKEVARPQSQLQEPINHEVTRIAASTFVQNGKRICSSIY